MLKVFNKQRGDTIIEVLFAGTVFSLVAVGGLSVMNQGSSISQRALEITIVRQNIDAQAEALRFLHNSYVASYEKGSTPSPGTPAGQWSAMLTNVIATNNQQASSFGGYDSCPVSPPNGSFVINTYSAKFVDPSDINYQLASTYSRINYVDSGGVQAVGSTTGIWIEAVRSDDSADVDQAGIGFIDFHIRSCWDSVGLAVPMTIGTIVRLYEPR